ncbi:transposable element Tcb2 transposase [Trichonephila clavipes]|nr:transposable element Tcb2 transposase [Trichonephila clavipes]
MLGRRIAVRQPPPTCLPELRRALLDEWCNIPQDQIDNLILSMPRRKHVSAFCFQPGSHNGPPACLFLEESIRNVGEWDSRKPFSPTSSGSNTIRNEMVPEQHSPH